MRKVRIVLADDQVLFVESLRTVFKTRAKDIEVVAVAYDGTAALERVAETAPDLVLMDVRMPGLDGVEATRLISERFPGTRVLMLTTFDDDEYVNEAFHHGAVGYLLKDTPPLELFAAVRAAHEGAVQISPAVVAKFVAQSASLSNRGSGAAKTGGEEPAAGSEVRIDGLSPREKEILRLIAQGRDNKEIARVQCIAVQTVKNHVSAIYRKLGVRNRVEAARTGARALAADEDAARRGG